MGSYKKLEILFSFFICFYQLFRQGRAQAAAQARALRPGPRVRLPLLPRGLAEHVLRQDPVAPGGVVDQHVGDRPHQPAVL